MIAWRRESGLAISSNSPVANEAGTSSAEPTRFWRLVSHRRRGGLARHGLQLAYAVIEHLLQTLVDLPVGLGDLLAQRVFATGERLLVEIFLNMLAHLSANGLFFGHFAITWARTGSANTGDDWIASGPVPRAG